MSATPRCGHPYVCDECVSTAVVRELGQQLAQAWVTVDTMATYIRELEATLATMGPLKAREELLP